MYDYRYMQQCVSSTESVDFIVLRIISRETTTAPRLACQVASEKVYFDLTSNKSGICTVSRCDSRK